jgi:uncharacterized protein
VDSRPALVYRQGRHDRQVVGGFNALEIASHRPPELAAVISVASTDDRYADDVHYMGGCLRACDVLSWGSRAWESGEPRMPA